MNTNRSAFLTMIALSEGTEQIGNQHGYNVIVGSTPQHPHLFDSYDDHPRKLIDLGNGLQSTAAGRYQLLGRYFTDYKRLLKLPDFSPASQDAISIQQIKESHALDDVDSGRFAEAVRKCARIWASLPGNNYGQHENTLLALTGYYTNAGGLLNSPFPNSEKNK